MIEESMMSMNWTVHSSTSVRRPLRVVKVVRSGVATDMSTTSGFELVD
jgi:hypothetical protein